MCALKCCCSSKWEKKSSYLSYFFLHIFLQLKRFHSLTLVEECNLIISLALCGSNALVASQAGWSQKTISSHHFSVEDHIHFNPVHSNFHFLFWLYRNRKILGPVPIKIRFEIICFIVCQPPRLWDCKCMLPPFLCTMCTSFCTQMKTLFPTRDKKFASGHSWEDSLCAGHFLHLLALLICLKPSSTPQSLKLSPTLVENILWNYFRFSKLFDIVIHSKSEYCDPNDPAKKLNFPQIFRNLAQQWQNGPRWPKCDPQYVST